MHPSLRWLLLLVWAAIIFWLSSIPSLASPLPTLFDLLARNAAHATEYAVLTALLLWALQGRRLSLQLWVAGGGSILYAITDELHQHFVPGRVADALDLFLDALGVTIVLLLVLRHRQRSARG